MTKQIYIPSIEGKGFIVFSSIDWSRNWQIHQHLATSLVETGHPVLFIENTGVRAPRATASDFKRVWQRLRNWFNSTGGFSDVRDRLTVFSPLLLPFPYFWPAIQLNRWWVSRSIRKWMRANRFHNPVVITFLPTPLAQGVIDSLDPLAVIYYCADNMAEGSSGAKGVRRYEDRFFAKADAVFCTSHSLCELARASGGRVHLIPAGAEVEKFESARFSEHIPIDLENISEPRVGYIGSVRDGFDQKLIRSAASALPNVNFVIVGPESVDTSLLRSLSNVYLLGAKSYNLVPFYVNAFNVTLIPYVQNKFTDSVYFCKLNEYLALGKPVVATNLREIRLYAEHYPGVIDVVSGTQEFIDAIQVAFKGEQDPEAAERRVAAARQNSWEQRFNDIMSAISEVVAAKQARQPRWQNLLLGALRRARIKALKVVVAAAAVYGLLFYTPLVWWAGQQLIVHHPPTTAAEAIVVFSGDGEPGYVNAGYQKRAMDVFKLYQSGYGRTIILSSGKRFALAETEVIRALLVSQGVPDSAIVSTTGVPTSTVENVTLVADTLRQLKLKRVLFVTAPYHTRRAAMVWAKQAPDINVTVVQAEDEAAATVSTSVSFKTARVIGFEYTAILYYRIKGWL